MPENTILVIGNGFDLYCGRETKYSEFFESKIFREEAKIIDEKIKIAYENSWEFGLFEIVDLLKDDSNEFNFFVMYFILASYSGTEFTNWSHIEKEIEHMINSDLTFVIKIISSRKKGDCKISDISKSHRYKNEHFFILSAIFLLKITESYEFDIPDVVIDIDTEPTKNDILVMLFNELKQFENIFSKYVISLPKDDKISENIASTLDSLSGNKFKNKNCLPINTLFNFNYTELHFLLNNPNQYYTNLIQIHGDKYNPVFGIDPNGIESVDNKFKFTKLSRIIKKKNGTKIKMPKDIKTLTFFGHSLDEADYSYFATLFSLYDIFNNPITLKFYYYNYLSEDSVKVESEYKDSVIQLLSKYSGEAKLTNMDPSLLLYKLLLENRLEISEIENNELIKVAGIYVHENTNIDSLIKIT